jgi:biotin transporter BioY
MLKDTSNTNKMNIIDLAFPKIENKVLVAAKDIFLVLSFSVLTGISSKLMIEIGPVPITMQTLAVLLSVALLGKKKAVASQITYILGGLLGLPWFSRGGGMAYILNPSFGYILGFVLAAYSIGTLFERGWGKNIGSFFLVMLIGNCLIYVPGLLWLGNFVGFSKLLEIGLYPFILGDILKILLASSVSKGLNLINH